MTSDMYILFWKNCFLSFVSVNNTNTQYSPYLSFVADYYMLFALYLKDNDLGSRNELLLTGVAFSLTKVNP